MGLFLLGEIQPVTEFNSDRNAPKRQRVDLDSDGNGSGLRLWKGTVTDPSATSSKQASFEVQFVANVQPVPSADEIAPGMRPIVLEGLHVKPKMSGQGEFKSIAWNVRASGIMGDTSGAKRAAAEKAA
ncbi:hypothetical protein [Nocardia sp. alder85J]|uniref:hypothetical protein n=1 Tax=Nocardia sp. alder85J TaxID=2862949 RepID=UPI001CD57F85|nr:hypothetical protein [Nocardia sp. alder85J]MCX4093668.1 hypothetical protein [Nocardia sp. alder85J]